MTETGPHVFPPPFDGRRPGGGTVRITDVDELLLLAADHAGVPLKRLDRRRLEESLHMIGAPALSAERAVMVFAGRARQERRRAMRHRIRRSKAAAWLVAASVLVVLYGVRLHARLETKLASVRAAGESLGRARTELAELAVEGTQTAPPPVGGPVDPPGDGDGDGANEPSAARRDAAEDQVALARRRYDDRANDYDAAVRGFPTAPFVKLVGLPSRVPMSWERGAPGEPRASIGPGERSP